MQRSRRLRAGVIGAGSWAAHAHIPVLVQRDEVDLVSVCRPGRDALDRLKQRYGFEVATEDYAEALSHELDIVVVASPTALHHEHVAAALAAGAHVLCEKPMTIAPADAWDLIARATAAGTQLLLSFGWNFSPMIRKATALLREHGIGELEHVTVHMSSATRELLSNSGSYPDADPETLPQQSTWTDPRLSGGGYAQAQLSHALALLFGLFPVRAVAATSLMKAVLDAPVETHAAIAFEFDNGAIGAVSGGSNHVGAWDNKHELELHAIGSEGRLIVDVHRELVWLARSDGSEFRLETIEGDGAYRPFGPANALVDVALGRLSENSAPGELGARTVEALQLAYGGVRAQTRPSAIS